MFRSGGLPSRAEIEEYGEVWAVLLDAPHASLYGGTGAAWDYGAITGAVAGAELGGRRLFLAGGLGPGNARRAINAARPFAIDVCSRVESAPGIKDPELRRRLFQEVKHGETPNPS